MKRILCICMCLMMALMAVGCKNEEKREEKTDNKISVETPINVYTADNLPASSYFVKKNDKFELCNVEFAGGDTHWINGYYAYDCGYADIKGDTARIPCIDRMNDQLVTTLGSSKFTLQRVDQWWYSYPAWVDSFRGEDYLSLGKVRLNVQEPPFSFMYEINGCTKYWEGLEISGVGTKHLFTTRDFSDSLYALISDQIVSFEYGMYEGTKYVSHRLTLDSMFCTLGSRYVCPVEKTKDGYFVIDLSMLPPGMYAVYCGDTETAFDGDQLISIIQ